MAEPQSIAPRGMLARPHDGRERNKYTAITAVACVLAILVIAIAVPVFWPPVTSDKAKKTAARAMRAAPEPRASAAPPPCRIELRDASLHQPQLYSAADVDPLVTGQLYAAADFMRPMYSQRVSLDDTQGLLEYSSSGSPGDVGVDVPNMNPPTYDDGIPEEWAFPSTPIRWYKPLQRDYYGKDGPTPYAEGLYWQSEPDHDPPE